jgi:hypothetical protein
MHKNPRTVQRYITQLEKRGLVTRKSRYRPGRGGQAPNGYSLAGLVKQLEALEPEFRKMVELNRDRRRRVERPKEGGAPEGGVRCVKRRGASPRRREFLYAKITAPPEV